VAEAPLVDCPFVDDDPAGEEVPIRLEPVLDDPVGDDWLAAPFVELCAVVVVPTPTALLLDAPSVASALELFEEVASPPCPHAASTRPPKPTNAGKRTIVTPLVLASDAPQYGGAPIVEQCRFGRRPRRTSARSARRQACIRPIERGPVGRMHVRSMSEKSRGAAIFRPG
jgi:hypothetical protein